MSRWPIACRRITAHATVWWALIHRMITNQWSDCVKHHITSARLFLSPQRYRWWYRPSSLLRANACVFPSVLPFVRFVLCHFDDSHRINLKILNAQNRRNAAREIRIHFIMCFIGNITVHGMLLVLSFLYHTSHGVSSKNMMRTRTKTLQYM